MLSVFIIIINKEGWRKLLEWMDMFMAEIVMMISWVCIYLQTHQVVYSKHIKLFVCQLYHNKAAEKKKNNNPKDEASNLC